MLLKLEYFFYKYDNSIAVDKQPLWCWRVFSIDLCGAETEIIWVNYDNFMAADTVAPWIVRTSGPCLNIKTVLSTYGNFHVKDKTAVRTSYL